VPGFGSHPFWSACGLSVLVVVFAIPVSACGGQRDNKGDPISRGAALPRVYEAIDSGPSWATAQDATAVRANINYAPGSNARCGPSYGESGPEPWRFVCYLRYLDASRQPQRLWFSENGNGSRIVPMTRSRFQAFAGDAVAYERSHLPVTPPVVASAAGGTIASRIEASAKAQPRVRGTACDGPYGMRDATPAASTLTAGNYLIAGSGTSCQVAQVVATALGDSSNPASAVLSVPDQTTRGRLKLRCRDLSRSGPVECAAPRAAVVYVGSYDAPLPPSS
jgi:hypothetical protein